MKISRHTKRWFNSFISYFYFFGKKLGIPNFLWRSMSERERGVTVGRIERQSCARAGAGIIWLQERSVFISNLELSEMSSTFNRRGRLAVIFTLSFCHVNNYSQKDRKVKSNSDFLLHWPSCSKSAARWCRNVKTCRRRGQKLFAFYQPIELFLQFFQINIWTKFIW